MSFKLHKKKYFEMIGGITHILYLDYTSLPPNPGDVCAVRVVGGAWRKIKVGPSGGNATKSHEILANMP
jgi:hypothetical protein